MPRIRSLCLLSAALACASLSAQEPAPKPAEQAPAATPEKAQEKQPEKTPEKTSSKRHFHHYHHHSTFGAYAQAIFPQKELKDALDGGTGYGLGVQWTHDHGDWNASRTRIEARYVVSSVQNTYDGNSVQASLGWHF